MLKTESLVPPLALCKLIPKEDFKNSALVWNLDFGFVENRETAKTLATNSYIPAPSLKEIMLDIYDIDDFSVSAMKARENGGDYHVAVWRPDQTGDHPEVHESYSETAKGNDIESAALRLWFKLNDVEVPNAL